MGTHDDVPVADHLEQEAPPLEAQRDSHRIPPEAPDADVLEQERPLVDEGKAVGLDAERTEPVSDDEWASTSSG